MNQIVGINDDGMTFLALELEPGNIHRLRQGDPILLHVQDLFPDGIPKRLELVVSFSETPIASARKMSGQAEVVIDERSRVTKQPHCPECKSTVEQIGVWRNESPMALTFCATCGCIFGMV